MGAGIPLDAGALMSTVLEGILYGFSVLMFVGTIWSLTYKRHMQDMNRPIAVVAVLLLILSTAVSISPLYLRPELFPDESPKHMVVNIIRAEDGLVRDRNILGGPSAYFADVSQQTYVIKHSIYVLQTLLADGVVIYRCYVVWQSVWIVVLPIMLWCSVAVTGVIALYSVSQAGTGSGIFLHALAQWVTAFFASTIATNLLSSGLLAYRIWTIQRSISGVHTTARSTVMPIVRVLVDAAILYSAALLTALILFVRGNNGQDAVVDLAMPIMSIAFYMVLIRIALNKKDRTFVSTTSLSIPRRTASEVEQERSRQLYAMKPLQVHVAQFTHEDRTSTGTRDSVKGVSIPQSPGSV
ncbi:hypothetical protein DEU56DRAFT_979173 [Suillus clintonianus]|uniref:uncharacterized protein n=1 Tax=Suillus clintonianus TaxID=1904413 RepID=UPI001B878F7B|nr:uncharacterized protein DEU56DRAFT_979173 [Suillus clintonianus]KAG2144617.1 hypothetical protein DEU56DRAFT_979173 [Suillus clintonianus]